MNPWQPVLEQLSPSAFSSQKAYCVPLDHLSCLEVTGSQAQALLQGQLTCDLNALASNCWSEAAHCTPKGRMISNFQIHATERGYRLLPSFALCDTQTKALSKYSPLYRGEAEVSDLSEQVMGIGLIGDAALKQLEPLGFSLPEPGELSSNANGTVIRQVDGTRAMLWLEHDQALECWSTLSQQLTAASSEFWQLCDIRQGRVQIDAIHHDQFIPQQVSLDALNAISFNKGCYTGQEIIARLHYRGKQKNHLHHVQGEGAAPAASTPLARQDNGEQAGEIINSAAIDTNTFEALAVIRDADFENSAITLARNGQNPLKMLELPYTVDND